MPVEDAYEKSRAERCKVRQRNKRQRTTIPPCGAQQATLDGGRTTNSRVQACRRAHQAWLKKQGEDKA